MKSQIIFLFIYFCNIILAKNICYDKIYNIVNNYTIYGQLCSPVVKENNKNILQFLVHGTTTDHRYWNPEILYKQYSYVLFANNNGYTTLSIDRLGNGKSSHPENPNIITLDLHINYINQILNEIKNSKKYDKIIIIGHSLGSFISMVFSNEYKNTVDGLILTGYSHKSLNNIPTTSVKNVDLNIYPQFKNLSKDYFTTTNLSDVENIFYYPNFYNVEMAKYNEKIKQIYTASEYYNFSDIQNKKLDIKIPILQINGEEDKVFDYKWDNFTYYNNNNRKFNLIIIPKTGHVINYHYNSKNTFNKIIKWIEKLNY